MTKFCFDHGAKLEGETVVENAFKRTLTSKNPEVVNELKKRGYIVSMAEWDEKSAAKFLADVYKSGGYTMLKEAILFAPSDRAIVLAGDALSYVITDNEDHPARSFFEAKGVVFIEPDEPPKL